MRRHGAAAAAIVVGLMASACEPSAGGGPSDGPAAVNAEPSAAGSPAAEALPTGHPSAASTAGAAATRNAGVSPSAPSSVDLLAGTPVLANCGPSQVRWTLTHLSDAPATTDGQRPVARLTAINSSPTVCAFDGYPWFRVHVGKGPQTVAQPSLERAQRLTLAPGRTVDTDLYYSETDDTPNGCAMPAGERPQAQALPPGAATTATRIVVPLTDGHGHLMPLAVCSDDIRMAAPVLG